MNSRRVVAAALRDSVTAWTGLRSPAPGVREQVGDRPGERRERPTGRPAPTRRRSCATGDQPPRDRGDRRRARDSVRGRGPPRRSGRREGPRARKAARRRDEKLRAIARRGVKLGVRPTICELNPNSNFSELDDPIRRLNERIRGAGRQRERAGPSLLRDARRPGAPGPDAPGVDAPRQPCLRRGPAPPRRARLPAFLLVPGQAGGARGRATGTVSGPPSPSERSPAARERDG